LWLLLQRAELWWQIDGDAHDLLAEQGTPYAALFAHVERCLHDHGPMSPPALIEEIAHAVSDDELAQTTLTRVASFHEPEAQTDLKLQLDLLLDQLRLQEVDHELKLLFESGLMSPDIQTRSAALLQSRARLKAALSTPARPPV
jgi:DNA primase